MAVTETDPGVKGDTASGGGTKPATLESGVVVQVPLFVNEGRPGPRRHPLGRVRLPGVGRAPHRCADPTSAATPSSRSTSAR